MSLGQQIKKIRKDAGWTLQEVSDRSGLHKSNISEIENEKRFKPSVKTLERLAQALDCQVGDFFERSEDPDDEITQGMRDLLADVDARLLYNIMDEEIIWLQSIRFRTNQHPTRDTYLDLLKTYRKLSLSPQV